MTEVVDEERAINGSAVTLSRLDDEARALLFTEARTANSFAPTPVTDEELSSIWELARWAPTAANVQPLRVLYVRPGEGRERLVAHMSEGNQAKTATAPAVAMWAASRDCRSPRSTAWMKPRSAT